MLPLSHPTPRFWSISVKTQRYSYGAVVAAVAVGLLAPGLANWLLGPALLVGMVLLGVAHGACDQYVVPATHPTLAEDKLRYWARFLVGYLGLAAAVGVLWWWQPAMAVTFFFVLTVWHWGSADAPAQARHRAQWLAHSLLRGSLIFAVPLWHQPFETQATVNGLLELAGAAPVRAAAIAQAAAIIGPAVLVGHLVLWLSYVWESQSSLALTDALEVALLTLLLVVLPPVLSGGMYFVFWHSLQHVLRMNQLMDHRLATRRPGLVAELKFFLRRSAPLLLISIAGLAVVFGLAWTRAASGSVLVSLALLAASVVTLPHALLVTLGMDAPRWRRAESGGS
ncbi:Brp/Blh family beta-carotene 15,15'-dioxygenase [Hymenobacter sp.]|uniref:Brp/Blh family beta-carotene 15,15'-dioxygenase n=1 Tax=Hymenobacter sp. TaxID=1898978 RepID=UPI00286A98A4|nr:Brp/Blh family beta-carotene 15,15'-dioxygenase [Hymenobacter sp.]